MTTDVDMKELPAPSNSASSTSPSTLSHLKEIASLIETAAYSRKVEREAECACTLCIPQFHCHTRNRGSYSVVVLCSIGAQGIRGKIPLQQIRFKV